MFEEQTEARRRKSPMLPVFIQPLTHPFSQVPIESMPRVRWPLETRENTAVSEGRQPILHSVEALVCRDEERSLKAQEEEGREDSPS